MQRLRSEVQADSGSAYRGSNPWGATKRSTSPHSPEPSRTSSNEHKLLILGNMLRIRRPCKVRGGAPAASVFEGTIAGTLITFCGYGTNPALKAVGHKFIDAVTAADIRELMLPIHLRAHV